MRAESATTQLGGMLGQLVEALQLRERWGDDLHLPVPLRPVLEDLAAIRKGFFEFLLFLTQLCSGATGKIELLEESLGVLEDVDVPLERARTLVELGAALRRGNQRAVAREPLTAGLELAHVCGAERLAARAPESPRIESSASHGFCGALRRRAT